MIDYIEFIRHLEQKGYPFGTPPDTATQWLANSREPETQRLLQRAKMLDATQEIQSSLQQWRQHIHRWQKWLSLAFFGAGCFGFWERAGAAAKGVCPAGSLHTKAAASACAAPMRPAAPAGNSNAPAA